VRQLTRHARPALAGARRAGAVAGAALAAAALTAPAASATKAPHSPAHAPVVSTGGAQHVGDTAAEVSGTVNPRGLETTYSFQYGPTPAYGQQTPTTAVGTGTVGVKVSQIVSGLPLGTVYHYRLVATSAAGTTDGSDRTFTTKQTPLRFVLPGRSTLDTYGSPFSLAGTLTGTDATGRQLILQASPFPYVGAFANLGGAVTTSATGGFSFSVPGPPQNTELRVSTLEALPSYSQVVSVRVAVRVTLQARRAGPERVRFSGTVAPAEVGAPVLIQLAGRTGRGEVSLGTTTARYGSASTSRFSVVVHIGRTGSYRALVKVTNGRQVSGASRSLLLRAAPRMRRVRHGRR
jgi:hypothetical protein